MLNREDVKDPEHADREILKKLKMDGLAGGEPEILERLDKDLALRKSVESLAVPVKYTAKGTLAGNSKVADQEQFSTIMNYVNYKAREIGQEILGGNVEVNPFAYQKESACDYCPYRNVCGFDEKIPGYSFRRLGTCKPEEIWEKMKDSFEKSIHWGGGIKMAVSWTKEQQKVIDTRDCNILVSAAAGSGKTAVLVERILERIMDKNGRWILTGCWW